MSWTRQDQERAFDLTRPVLCGTRHGTAFPIRVCAEAAWYLTCAHVLAEHGGDKPASVGGIPAQEVISGAPVGLDLALLRLPGKVPDPGQPAALPIAPFASPARACRIPGCYRPAEMKSFLRDWIDATIDGERTDIISADGSLAMKGWRLDVAGSLLEQGYSGSPVICAKTGRVFAVAVMRTDGGKGGIAICISNLARILPADLSGLLPTQQGSALTGLLRTILSDPVPGLDCAAIRALIRRSAPPGAPFDWPATEGIDTWCAWLLDRLPFSNARHPLYDLLDWLAGRLGDDAVRLELVRQAQQNLLALYPDINRAPLPEPGPQAAPTPALFEVVFEPLPAASFKAYAVHSHVHSPQPGPASPPQAGPLREPEGGGRLDPHNQTQVIAYVKELTGWGLALGLDPRTCIFQFRVPRELMLHPFDAWPRNLMRLPLGRDYPVVIGATERDWAGCDAYWASMQAGLTQPLGKMLTGCDPGQPATLDAAALEALLGQLLETPCLALQGVPDEGAGDALTYLCVVAELGVAALWPRTPAAANGFCTALQEGLGAVPLGQLPFALRDLRNQAAGKADAPALWRDLTLFWDDPHRSAKSPRARFLPGLGSDLLISRNLRRYRSLFS